MELDREAIERRDFSTARRGYEPAEVDEHLRAIAREVEELQDRGQSSSTLSGAASERLRLILDAAEASAEEMRSEAEEEARRLRTDAQREARTTRAEAERAARETTEAAAREASTTTAEAEHRAREREAESERIATEGLSRVEQRTRELLERADSLDAEFDALLERMRTAGNGAVESLRAQVDALQAAAEEPVAEPGGDGGSSTAARSAGRASAVGEDTLIIEPEEGREPRGDEPLGDEVIPEPHGGEALPDPPDASLREPGEGPVRAQEPAAPSQHADESSAIDFEEPAEPPAGAGPWAADELEDSPADVSTAPVDEEPPSPVEPSPRDLAGGGSSRRGGRSGRRGRQPAPMGSHEPEQDDGPSQSARTVPSAEETAGRPARGSSAQAAESGSADVEGARLIALNMALSGSSREETAQYLRETFGLDDDALLDDVYERVNPA